MQLSQIVGTYHAYCHKQLLQCPDDFLQQLIRYDRTRTRHTAHAHAPHTHTHTHTHTGRKC